MAPKRYLYSEAGRVTLAEADKEIIKEIFVQENEPRLYYLKQKYAFPNLFHSETVDLAEGLPRLPPLVSRHEMVRDRILVGMGDPLMGQVPLEEFTLHYIAHRLVEFSTVLRERGDVRAWLVALKTELELDWQDGGSLPEVAGNYFKPYMDIKPPARYIRDAHAFLGFLADILASVIPGEAVDPIFVGTNLNYKKDTPHTPITLLGGMMQISRAVTTVTSGDKTHVPVLALVHLTPNLKYLILVNKQGFKFPAIEIMGNQAVFPCEHDELRIILGDAILGKKVQDIAPELSMTYEERLIIDRLAPMDIRLKYHDVVNNPSGFVVTNYVMAHCGGHVDLLYLREVVLRAFLYQALEAGHHPSLGFTELGEIISEAFTGARPVPWDALCYYHVVNYVQNQPNRKRKVRELTGHIVESVRYALISLMAYNWVKEPERVLHVIFGLPANMVPYIPIDINFVHTPPPLATNLGYHGVAHLISAVDRYAKRGRKDIVPAIDYGPITRDLTVTPDSFVMGSEKELLLLTMARSEASVLCALINAYNRTGLEFPVEHPFLNIYPMRPITDVAAADIKMGEVVDRVLEPYIKKGEEMFIEQFENLRIDEHTVKRHR